MKSRDIIGFFFNWWDYLKCKISGVSLILHGSYYTTNVGDRTLAIVLKNELAKQGLALVITSRFIMNPPVKNIVVGGGGIIHNINDKNIKLRTHFLNKQRNVYFVGIGAHEINKFSRSEKEQLKKMSNANYISLRDKNSFFELTNFLDSEQKKFQLGQCPSWLFSDDKKYKDISLRNFFIFLFYNIRYSKYTYSQKRCVRGKDCRIGLNLRYSNFDKIERRRIAIQKIANLSKNNQIIFIPFYYEDLRFYVNELSRLNIKCLKLQNPIKTFNSVKKMDKMIATRYHSFIFSLLNNKPVMILGYHQKVIALAEEMNMKYFDMIDDKNNDFVFNKPNKSHIGNKINKAREERDKLSKFLKKLMHK